MGFSGKPEQAEDGIQNAPEGQDVEKRIPSHQETPGGGTVAAAAIDPELERRVLRKLDWRVPTLTAFLCMISVPPIRGTVSD